MFGYPVTYSGNTALRAVTTALALVILITAIPVSKRRSGTAPLTSPEATPDATPLTPSATSAEHQENRAPSG